MNQSNGLPYQRGSLIFHQMNTTKINKETQKEERRNQEKIIIIKKRENIKET